MKICAVGRFGKFSWEVPQTITDSLNLAIKDLPADEQVVAEKQFISWIEQQLENFIILETVTTIKMLLGNADYAHVMNSHILMAQAEMVALRLAEGLDLNNKEEG